MPNRKQANLGKILNANSKVLYFVDGSVTCKTTTGYLEVSSQRIVGLTTVGP